MRPLYEALAESSVAMIISLIYVMDCAYEGESGMMDYIEEVVSQEGESIFQGGTRQETTQPRPDWRKRVRIVIP